MRIEKKFLYFLLLSSTLYAGEIEWGSGTFYLSGGFSGLTKTLDTDVTAFTLKEQHKNIFSSNYFYSYSIVWYDSDKMTQIQSTLNNVSNIMNSYQNTVTIPSFDHKLQGLDINFALGRDIYASNQNQYFGLGILLGASIPWIDSDDTTDNSSDDSTTEILTFKVGPTLVGSYSFNNYFMLYANASVAYQYGSVKNDDLDTDTSVDGIFYSADIGLRFQPLNTKYQITKWLTLSPKLYFTLGYRYSHWDVNDVSLDLSGNNITAEDSTLSFATSIAYFGIGYDLF